MKVVEWHNIHQPEIAAYRLEFDSRNCYRGSRVRLIVEMQNGGRHYLNDVEYDSMTIAAMALPDVLRLLNGDIVDLDGADKIGEATFIHA